MLFGAPKQGGEVFTNLGFDINSQETTIVQPPTGTELPETIVDTSSAALQQLTTRPVAGFTFVTTDDADLVRYTERGTGHIYEINLETGIEETLSRTTIPQVSAGVFSPNGEMVALTSYVNYTPNVFVGSFGEDTNIVGISLQPGAENISFPDDETVLYTVSSNNTTTGYRHNIQTLSQTEIFSFNYTNLDVSWGRGLTDVYITTKPAYNLRGYIYKTNNNILTPVLTPEYGLSALISNDSIITTYSSEGGYTSSVADSNGNTRQLPLLALKEKCVFSETNTDQAWCASPLTVDTPTFVEDWYKGSLTSEDYLWLLDTDSLSATLLASPLETTGRVIDVKTIDVNSTENTLGFVNKIDQTLWIYDLLAE